jgi:hypothetical protein
MPLSTIFQLYRGGQVEETGVPGETTDPLQVIDKLLSYTVVSSTPRLNGIRTRNYSGNRH